MPSFDAVLKEAGEFGSFQKRAFLLLSQTGITFSFLFVGIVFLGPKPENFTCKLPYAAEISDHCGWTVEEEHNFTHLAGNLVNSSYGHQCQRYDIEWNTTSVNCASPLAHLTNNSLGSVPLTTCQNGWLYEQPHSTIASEYNLVCAKDWLVDLTQSILNLGFLIGAFTLGYAADRYGRISTYLFSCFGAGLCGLIVAFAPNFTVFVIFRFLQGVFGKGTWMTSFVIVTEIVGSKQRRIVGIVIQMFFTLGVVILPGIAYLIPTWQGIQLATTLPNFIFLLYYWIVPESPRWLLSRKEGDKAMRVMHSIAKQNGKCLSPHYSEIVVTDEEVTNPSFLDLVRTPQMRKFTLILMYAWFTSAVVYQGLVLRLGIIEGNLYLEFFVTAMMELPAALLILLIIDRIGRRLPFVISTIVAGGSCLITAFLPEDILWLKTSFSIMARVAITMSFELVYLVNSELYPTTLRNFGVAICSGLCDIGGIVAPFLLYRLADIWVELPLIVYTIAIGHERAHKLKFMTNFGRFVVCTLKFVAGIFCVLCGILLIFLPETKGISLPETVEDVEQLRGFSHCCGKSKQQEINSYI